jgi:hypothetical protein
VGSVSLWGKGMVTYMSSSEEDVCLPTGSQTFEVSLGWREKSLCPTFLDLHLGEGCWGFPCHSTVGWELGSEAKWRKPHPRDCLPSLYVTPSCEESGLEVPIWARLGRNYCDICGSALKPEIYRGPSVPGLVPGWW